MELRDYQQEARQLTHEYLACVDEPGVVIIPTGGGKTVVFCELIKDWFAAEPNTRVCILADRQELLTQAADKMEKVWPGAPVGIWSAGLGKRDATRPITIAGIQSVYKRACDFDPFDVLIIDEAHLIPAQRDTMYGQFIEESALANPRRRIIGFTATPFRLDGGYIYGEKKRFRWPIIEVPIKRLLDEGYLAPLSTYLPPDGQIDVSKLHRRGGEFIPGEVESEAIKVVREATRAIVSYGQSRHSWLIFSPGVAHAELVAQELQDYGIAAACVVGDTDSDTRRDIISQFDQSRLRALVNVGCLTTGFDVTRIDLIAVLRATESVGLWMQMCGRGMRLHPGKTDCLVLDFGGNIRRHGPIDHLIINEPGEKGEGAAPYKTCPECRVACHARATECPDCGYQFPEPELIVKHDADPETAPILSSEIGVYTVEYVTAKIHYKEGSPDSLKVSYHLGGLARASYSEWVCFGHMGRARAKAEQWWRLRYKDEPVPPDAHEALSKIVWIDDAIGYSFLSAITDQIAIRRNGKYMEICRIKFKRPTMAVTESASRTTNEYDTIAP